MPDSCRSPPDSKSPIGKYRKLGGLSGQEQAMTDFHGQASASSDLDLGTPLINSMPTCDSNIHSGTWLPRLLRELARRRIMQRVRKKFKLASNKIFDVSKPPGEAFNAWLFNQFCTADLLRSNTEECEQKDEAVATRMLSAHGSTNNDNSLHEEDGAEADESRSEDKTGKDDGKNTRPSCLRCIDEEQLFRCVSPDTLKKGDCNAKQKELLVRRTTGSIQSLVKYFSRQEVRREQLLGAGGPTKMDGCNQDARISINAKELHAVMLAELAQYGRREAIDDEVADIFNFGSLSVSDLELAVAGKRLDVVVDKSVPGRVALKIEGEDAAGLRSLLSDQGLAHEITKKHYGKLTERWRACNLNLGRAMMQGHDTLMNQDIFILLHRYQTMFGPASGEGRGWHLATPSEAMEAKKVSCELFASPMNAYCSKFCSVFIDTDQFFGSCGSFFRQGRHLLRMGGRFECGPIYDPAVMDEVASVLLQGFEQQQEKPLTVIMVLPDWPGCPGVDRLRDPSVLLKDNSAAVTDADIAPTSVVRKICRKAISLDKEGHRYQNGFQHMIKKEKDRYVWGETATLLLWLINDIAWKDDYGNSSESLEAESKVVVDGWTIMCLQK